MTSPVQPIFAAKFAKNSREEIRVVLSEYRGKTIINVRVWFQGDDGEMRPGKTGIALAIRHLPALSVALDEALERARELRLVD